VEIRFAANKQTVHVAPAHEVFKTDKNFATGEVTRSPTRWTTTTNTRSSRSGRRAGPVRHAAVRAAVPDRSKRLELKALSIHTAETLAALDGPNLKNSAWTAAN
jgi:hypothetical protein